MNCHAVKNVLDLFSEGRLTAARLTRIKGHLSGCQACSQEASTFVRLRSHAKIQAPAALKSRLEKLLNSPPVSVLPREKEWSFGEGAGAAAYAVLLLALNLAGPGISSQKFDRTSPVGEYR